LDIFENTDLEMVKITGFIVKQFMPNILKIFPIMKTASVLNLCMYVCVCLFVCLFVYPP